ncbi:hypothetical protein A9Q81_25990 [Gammaproteobacteria bacterium 42_54_T18]|nr:hypothetical protein A9Q81_25990 [Gammaproteobacteria bacterium 42_54_T18]
MKKTNIQTIVTTALLFLTLLFASAAQAKSYYKWIDERGVTHYGSQPPAAYINSAIKINVSSSTPSGKAAAQTKIDARKKKMNEKPPVDKTNSVEQQAQKEQDETNKKNCDIYRKNITLIGQNNRIREKNDEGAVVMLSEEERQARLKKAKDFISEFCK